jgi:hypothetical protein
MTELRRLNGAWIVPAIALAAVSMLTAALQQRRVLRAAGLQLPVRSMMAITLAGNAVSVTLPLPRERSHESGSPQRYTYSSIGLTSTSTHRLVTYNQGYGATIRSTPRDLHRPSR